MRFSRARYVTLCQQSLVTAAVLAVGVSAAGVKTLDIVPAPGYTPGASVGAQQPTPGALPQEALAGKPQRRATTEVDSAPVTPKVREVKVTGISAGRPSTPADGAALARASLPARRPRSRRGDAPGATARRRSPRPRRCAGYATVGVTWKHGVNYAEDQIDIQVRTEQERRWSGWTNGRTTTSTDRSRHRGGGVRRERPGTDALVVGDVDRVQMRADDRDGSTPPDLKLAVIDPGTGTMAKQAPAIDTSKLTPSPSRAARRPAARRRETSR